MRHLIIGNGNLGNAIVEKLKEQQIHTIRSFSLSNGWKYPKTDHPYSALQDVYDFCPDHVWCTVGAGSVEGAKANFTPYNNLHIRLPIELAQTLHSNVTLHLFSSDYVETLTSQTNVGLEIRSHVKSLYALSKQTMEHALFLINRPKTYIYRVGSLYGTYKPQKCFPYKIKKKYLEELKKENLKLYLPKNYITPTPTDWLANKLIENLEDLSKEETKLYNVAPMDCCSVAEWATLILSGTNIIIENKNADPERPLFSNIGCDLPNDNNESWLNLWNKREQHWFDILEKIT